MIQPMRETRLRLLTLTGIFAALICLFTAYICHIPVGPNGGYLHFGDTFIYVAASLLPQPYALLAGAIGGGGLGSMALNLGYQRRMFIVLWVSVIVLVILVQIFQTIGTHFSISLDRRLTSVKKTRKDHSAKSQD